MKKRFVVILVLFSLRLTAQQEEYTAYLEQALEAVNNKDVKGFSTNFSYFSTAIEQEYVTPEILTKENFELYAQCLLSALNEGYLSWQYFNPGNIKFLEYDVDNHPENMILLAYLYLNGNTNISQDTDKAIDWCRRALEKENEDALTILTSICPVNLNQVTDPGSQCEKTQNSIKKAAEMGVFIAMTALADYYFYTSKEYEKAIQWYEKAFQSGNIYQKAQVADKMSDAYKLYSPVYSGKKAKHWEAEYVSCLEKYVNEYEKNKTPDPKDPEFSKYQSGLMNLALSYLYSIGVKNKKKGEFYRDKACRNGVQTNLCENYKP